MQRLIMLLQKNKVALDYLNAVAALNLPDSFIAAGYLRNMVWDHIHGFDVSSTESTLHSTFCSSMQSSINDIDVIYYDRNDEQSLLARTAHQSLSQQFPQIKWQIKNQAFMHIKNHDSLYQSSEDAMRYWPDLETSIGAKIVNEKIVIVAPFGVSSLFAGHITFNEKCEMKIFQNRIKQKKWLEHWPKLLIKIPK